MNILRRHLKALAVVSLLALCPMVLVGYTGKINPSKVTTGNIVATQGTITSLTAPTWTGANGETITNTPDGVVVVTANDDAVETLDLQRRSTNTAGEDGNTKRESWWFLDDAGTDSEFAAIDVTMLDETSTSTDASFTFFVATADTLAAELVLTGARFTPHADGGLALGTSGLSWGPIVADGAVDFNSTLNVQGAATFQGAVIRTSQQYVFNAGGKPGSANGWLTTGGLVNVFNYTLPASEASTATLVIPVRGLHVGDTITGFSIVGQIESAGNTVELDCDFRKMTATVGGNADTAIGTIDGINVTADTIISSAATGMSEVVAADETFYLLLSGTTAASTDIDIMGGTVTVTSN